MQYVVLTAVMVLSDRRADDETVRLDAVHKTYIPCLSRKEADAVSEALNMTTAHMPLCNARTAKVLVMVRSEDGKACYFSPSYLEHVLSDLREKAN